MQPEAAAVAASVSSAVALAANLLLLALLAHRLRNLHAAALESAASRPADANSSAVSAELAELQRMWLHGIRPKFEPQISSDPYLSPPEPASQLRLLSRFLEAERAGSPKTLLARSAARLEATAQFRREYACSEFHRAGSARRLLMHASNPGASVYFADIGLRDRSGEPVFVGRTSLMTDEKAPGRKSSDQMRPASHLRGALFVCDRAATQCGAGGASYILDLGAFPSTEMPPDDECARRGGRYWDADGAGAEASVASPPMVGPHLPHHLAMRKPLDVLREALRLMTNHYPAMLHRVYFYRPGPAFRFVLPLIKMWVPKSTRERFVAVLPGEEHLHFLADGPRGLRAEDVPRELGGRGASLGGDRFLLRAVERYDATATRGTQERERGVK